MESFINRRTIRKYKQEDIPAEKIDGTSLSMGRSISVDAPFVDGEDNSASYRLKL